MLEKWLPSAEGKHNPNDWNGEIWFVVFFEQFAKKRIHLLEEIGVGFHVIRIILDLNDDKSDFLDDEVTGVIQERIDHVKAGLTIGAKCGCTTGHDCD